MVQLPFWAIRERELGGRIFRYSNRMVPPSQWGWSPLWDGCLLAIYEGNEIPYGPTKVLNKNGVPFTTSTITKGQLIRIWPKYVTSDENGNPVIGIKMKHAYRRGIDENTVPFFYACYSVKCSISYNFSTSVYDIVKLSINNRSYSTDPEEMTGNMQYFYKLMITVINEFIFLDTQELPVPSIKSLKMDEGRFERSDFRRDNFVFFLSHMSYYLKVEEEEKVIERSRATRPKITIELESVERGVTVGSNYRSIPREDPRYTRSEYPVIGARIKDCAVTTKTSDSGVAYIVNDWLVVDWPDEHAHAYWVCRLQDKDYFLEEVSPKKYIYHRSWANAEHPLWRFYHTPGGYDQLRALCGF